MWATYVARVTSRRSYPMIGKRLNRNHTTLIHAFTLATELVRRNDAETITAIAEITRTAWQLHYAERAMVGAA
jgi:chromosomal replication initiation ATPase DnaA